MKTAIFFCFVGAFLSAPTLGIIWFATEDLVRSEEYGWSDLRTMFNLIRADLIAGRQVIISAPSTIFNPPVDTAFRLLTHWSGLNNNWIDNDTRLPYFYAIEGEAWDIELDHEVIHVVALETAEEEYEGGRSLRLNLTVRMDSMIMYSSLNAHGTWRQQNLAIQEGSSGSYFPNMEIRYEGRFHLERGTGQFAGHWFMGPSLNQSVITANHIIVGAVHVMNPAGENIFDWTRELQVDGRHVNDIFRDVFTVGLQSASATIDGLVRRLFGTRPYAVPQITLATAMAMASGFACRKRPHMDRRETKLYN